MASNDYRFITHWQVPGRIEAVSALLEDAASLPRWWPSVYLDARVLEPGGRDGTGKRVELNTKGWLPYTLRWQFRTVESRSPHGFTIEAHGDFVGRGVWTLEQRGADTTVLYDWRIRAEKPLLAILSFLLKPAFAANHRWAMARGEESLRLELARLSAPSAEAAARVPPPPGPTFVRRSRSARSGRRSES